MDKIIWDDSFSVGVRVLDEQHKKLVRMINSLIESHNVSVDNLSVDSEVVSDTLSEMTQYMNYHFMTEEKHMLDSDYPEYSTHKQQHDEFMEKTIQFCEDTIARKENIPAEVLSFLMDWLTNHILKSDMKFKPHLNSRSIT